MSIKNRKLNDAQVNDIRAGKLLEIPDSETAEYHSVSRKTVYNVLQGTRYANVPLPKLKDYPNYTVYQNGLIISNKAKTKLLPKNGKVRILDKKGKRVTVSLVDLIQKSLIAQ